MYVMTTEIWPNGHYENKYSVLQIVGYNSGRKVSDGSTWYENVVAAQGELNATEDIIKALKEMKLDTLKGTPISVRHKSDYGMNILLETILLQYNTKILAE